MICLIQDLLGDHPLGPFPADVLDDSPSLMVLPALAPLDGRQELFAGGGWTALACERFHLNGCFPHIGKFIQIFGVEEETAVSKIPCTIEADQS